MNKKRNLMIIIPSVVFIIAFLTVVIYGSITIKKLVDERNKLNSNINESYQLINEVSLNTIKANVMVYTTCYNTTPIFGIETEKVTGQGSGAIFRQDNEYYYLLTNNHVIYLQPEYHYQRFKIVDYVGNEYKGELLAKDPAYDLAILRIEKQETLTVLNLAKENPPTGTLVLAIGQPQGQSNTITIGKILGYQKITLKDTTVLQTNVEFNVIYHSAPINHGSSGGVLLDEDLNIIGINYAGSENSDKISYNSFAIPLEKIIEFLSKEGFIN